MHYVYKIENKVNKKVYVGQTVEPKRRYYFHFRSLKKGEHFNNYLQNSYNKHGANNFVFRIIEENILNKNINKRERFWILFLKDVVGVYNIDLNPEDFSGKNNPNYGKVTSDEVKQKISNSLKGNKLTKEQKNKISLKVREDKNPASKIDINLAKKIIEDKRDLNLTIYELGEKYKLNYDTISQVISGSHWTYEYLKDNYNYEVLNYKLSIKEAKDILFKKRELGMTYKEILPFFEDKISMRYLTRICQDVHPICEYL